MADYSIDRIIWGLSQFPPVPEPPKPYVAPNIDQSAEKYAALGETITKFLGYRPTDAELEAFPYEIYKFIIYSLRQRDQNPKVGGSELLKRFLMGPQEVWYELYRACSKLNNLVDPETIEAAYLNSLMRLLAFGNDLADVSTVATESEIRRTIIGAPQFWRERWLDKGIETAVRIATGNRYKIRDYFDFRYIVGENMILEDLENEDSYALSVRTLDLFRQGTTGVAQYGSVFNQFSQAGVTFGVEDIGTYIIISGDDSGSPSNNGFYEIVSVNLASQYVVVKHPGFPRAATNMTWAQGFKNDESLTEIRVVDEKTGQGDVNRDFLEKLLALQLYLSERINVVYVDFMDLFEEPGDLGQWTNTYAKGPISGAGFATLEVSDQVLKMIGNGFAGYLPTNRPTAAAWNNYQWKAKASLLTNPAILQLHFGITPAGDSYSMEISYSGFATGTVKLWSHIGAGQTNIATASFPSLTTDVYWAYTIEMYTTATGVHIRLYVDGNQVINESVVSTWDAGNIGFIVVGSASVHVAETELWQYPLDVVRIGPNP